MCVVIVKRLGLKHLCEGVQGQGCNSVEHWVWFVADAGLTPCAARDFSITDSQTVFVQSLCAVVCSSISGHIKHPKHWQLYNCLDTQKSSTH